MCIIFKWILSSTMQYFPREWIMNKIFYMMQLYLALNNSRFCWVILYAFLSTAIISWSISTKVWDRAGMELATLDLQSDSHLLPDMLPTALHGLALSGLPPVFKYFESRSKCTAWSGSKLFTKIIMNGWLKKRIIWSLKWLIVFRWSEK